MNNSKAPKVGVYCFLRVYLLVPNGLTIYHNTFKKKVTLEILGKYFEIGKIPFPLTCHWIFDQVENGARFVIDVEADGVILVWELNDEVWI